MTREERDALYLLNRAVARLEPAIARAVRQALAELRAGMTFGAFAERLKLQDVAGAVALLFDGPTGTYAKTTLENALADAVTEAGAIAARRITMGFTGPNVSLGFSRVDPFTVAAIADAVSFFADTQLAEWRTGVADLVQVALMEGQSSAWIERRIRETMGLTDYDRSIIKSYRDLLEAGDYRKALRRKLRDKRFDPKLKRLIKQGTRLTPAEVAKEVDRYREKLEAWRAQTYARTAALNAARAGEQVAWAQAEAAGVIAPGWRRGWLTSLDERVRPEHRAMNGQLVGITEPWNVPGLGPVLYPGQGEYNCRCTVLYIRPTMRQRDILRLFRGFRPGAVVPVPAAA